MGCLFNLITLPFRAVYWLFKALFEIAEFFEHRSHRKQSHPKKVKSKTEKNKTNALTITSLSQNSNSPRISITIELLFKAIDLVTESQQASASYLQRRLHIHYTEASDLVEQMEQLRIIGPAVNSDPRAVLLTPERWAEKKQSLLRS